MRLRRTSSDFREPGSALDWRARWRFGAARVREGILSWLSVVLLVLLISVPILLFFWLLFFTDIFNVQAITVLDARPHTEVATRELTEKAVEDVPFGKTIFLIPTDIIEQQIIRQLPQVRTVYVSRKLPSTLKVIVQEKKPALLLLSRGNYYFVDETGVAYEEAQLDTLPGLVLPTVKNQDANHVVTIGAPVVSSQFISHIRYIEKALPERLELSVAEIQIPSLSAREVYFILENNWEIRFDVTREAESQVTTLARIIDEVVPEDERGLIEYIDLRIPDRVYYKIRGAID